MNKHSTTSKENCEAYITIPNLLKLQLTLQKIRKDEREMKKKKERNGRELERGEEGEERRVKMRTMIKYDPFKRPLEVEPFFFFR